MYAPMVLLSLILIPSLPVIVVYLWFRFAKYQISVFRFFIVLLGGAAAIFPALLLQELLTVTIQNGRLAPFYEHFVRIAMTEELSRFFILLLIFLISRRIFPAEYSKLDPQKSINKAPAIGLIAGLGFALIETAIKAASGTGIYPLGIILTSAVHGACGSRIGSAAIVIRSNPFLAILRILTAAAIHGIYNMLIERPGFYTLAAICIAGTAMLTAILTIIGSMSENKTADQTQENLPIELDNKLDKSV